MAEDTTKEVPEPPPPQQFWVFTHPGPVERLFAISAADAAKSYADQQKVPCGQRVYVATTADVFGVELQAVKQS